MAKSFIEFQGRSFHERADRDAYEQALGLMDGVEKGRVLDLAAGSGYTTARLAAMGFSPKAYDINTEQFVPTELPIEKADLNRGIPEPDASCDAIMALEVIEHLENPLAFLREAARVLKPGGSLVLSTPNIVSVKSKLLFLFREELHLFYNAVHRMRDPFCSEAAGHITPVLPWMLDIFLSDCGFTFRRRTYSNRIGWRVRPFGRSMILLATRNAP